MNLYLTIFKSCLTKLDIKLDNRSIKDKQLSRACVASVYSIDQLLAGLIEGNGSIIVRKGKRQAPMIVFTFGKKEIPIN